MGLAVTGATLDGELVGLRAEGDRIVALGPGVEPQPGDQVIDGGGMALLPGLVNAHTHAAMTLFRGYADDLPLMEWLQDHIWPAEARLDAEDVYWGTRLACAEMIRTGTVAFWDMYWQPGATARAVLDAGLRVTIGAPLIDGGGDGDAEKIKRDAEAAFAELEEAGGGERVRASLAPHAIYTVSEGSLRWIAEESARREIPIQIHASETEGEVNDCLAAHGIRPVELLDRAGMLGPRTLLAHCVWLDDHERELIARSGTTIATNPVANMKLAVGAAFDLPAARAAGIAVGLGTDGAGSNNSLDLVSDMKHLALLQKHAAADASVASATEVLAIAAGAEAPLLGAAGRIEAGAAAHFLLVPTDSMELCLGSLAAGMVYSASGSIVDTTVAGGRVLMRGGRVEGIDEIVARARERAARIGLR
jgi:5-methylthioadenosine/S-adenosylhomocysteine deaminase